MLNPRQLPWKRILADLALAAVLIVFLVGTMIALGRVLGGNADGGDVVRLLLFPLVVGGVGYFMYPRARHYTPETQTGHAEDVYRRILSGGAIAVIVIALIITVAALKSSPSLSGSDLEDMLRARLGTAAGSTADPRTIRCPDKSFQDGDTARCTISTGTGSAEILLVTVLRDGDDWNLTIDVQ
ncbi:hypothetical protein [Rhodococcus jostii]|uniref:hypothetical protein n=1 Tax=Rhodococcus jostii TaxID=132919 RepID=UPI0036520CAE